jgi:hypothetical protein
MCVSLCLYICVWAVSFRLPVVSILLRDANLIFGFRGRKQRKFDDSTALRFRRPCLATNDNAFECRSSLSAQDSSSTYTRPLAAVQDEGHSFYAIVGLKREI